MPTHMPIMKPIFILSRQEGPWLLYPAGTGILIKAYCTSEIKCFHFFMDLRRDLTKVISILNI